jgi:hypothetical protein
VPVDWVGRVEPRALSAVTMILAMDLSLRWGIASSSNTVALAHEGRLNSCPGSVFGA